MKLVVGFIVYKDTSLKYLEHFLPSLRQALSFLKSTDYQVLAFDNSPNEDNRNRLALEYFHHKYKWSIRYYSTGQNIGFGSAYNVMIEQSVKLQAQYFFVINTDTLLEPDVIKKLILALDENPNVDAASPKIMRWEFSSLSKTGQIDSCGLQKKPGLIFYDLGQGEIDSGQYNQAEIMAPSGAAGLFKLEALKKIKDKYGYYDSRFFMYKEDCDLAYRFKLANFKAVLVPEAILYHDRTMAVYSSSWFAFLKNRRSLSKDARAWSFRNQHLLFAKYFLKETIWGKILIIKQIIFLLFFSLILEQFNLKEYFKIFKLLKTEVTS